MTGCPESGSVRFPFGLDRLHRAHSHQHQTRAKLGSISRTAHDLVLQTRLSRLVKGETGYPSPLSTVVVEHHTSSGYYRLYAYTSLGRSRDYRIIT